MYTNYKFDINFLDGVYVNIQDSNDEVLYVQILEYFKNESAPRIFDSLNMMGGDTKHMYRPWYGNWEVNIHKWDDDEGIVKIHTERYNEFGKNVLFVLFAETDAEYNTWVSMIHRLGNARGFVPTILEGGSEYNSNNFYRIYEIGRFDQVTSGLQQGYPNNMWASWRYFWSWAQPRNWNLLSSEEIFNDIVGITESSPNFRGFIV